jgi:arylsulfatase A-like enzyme
MSRAYANSPWSLPSITTILTGLYPGLHNAGRRTLVGPAEVTTDYSARSVEGGIQLTIGGRNYRFQMLHSSVPTLQEILGARGYYTGAIHSNGYISHPTRVLKGTDFVRHYPEGDAAMGSDHAIDWIEKNNELNFALFLHYIDPHQWPKRLPQPLRGRPPEDLKDQERARVLEIYDELCRYVDEHLDRFFHELERRGLMEKTYVVLLADHGERFFEKGVVGSHGGGYYESVLRVPLAFWGPDIPRRRIDTRVNLADVVPTVLDLLGVASAETELSGHTLRPLFEGQHEVDRDVVSEFILWSDEDHSALLRDHWKLITFWERRAVELYDLAQDPLELADVAAESPELTRLLHGVLLDHQRRAVKRFNSLTYEATHIDEETYKSLRALGYID